MIRWTLQRTRRVARTLARVATRAREPSRQDGRHAFLQRGVRHGSPPDRSPDRAPVSRHLGMGGVPGVPDEHFRPPGVPRLLPGVVRGAGWQAGAPPPSAVPWTSPPSPPSSSSPRDGRCCTTPSSGISPPPRSSSSRRHEEGEGGGEARPRWRRSSTPYSKSARVRAADRTVGNYLEQTPAFLVSLWLHAAFVSPVNAAAFGWVWIGARSVYPWAYRLKFPGVFLSTWPAYACVFYLLGETVRCALRM